MPQIAIPLFGMSTLICIKLILPGSVYGFLLYSVYRRPYAARTDVTHFFK